MKKFALSADHGRYPRARGLLGRIMNNANPADLSTIQASFEKYHVEAKAMRDEIGQIGDEVDKINNSIAALSINGVGGAGNAVSKRELAVFASYLRSGALDVKAAMVESGSSDGGYLVSQTVDEVIQNQLINLSPLRGYAKIVTLGSGAGVYSFNVNVRGTSSGWVTETAARPDTNTPSLARVTPPEGEIYANAKSSQWLLDDSSFDVVSFLQENISDEFSVQEGIAFVTGDGVNKPRGFMTYPTVVGTGNTDAARPYGTIQYLKTGAAANFAATDPGDTLISLVYALKAGYRAGPGVAWMMNSTTASIVQQFKDSQHRYLWTNGLAAGQPSMLLGYEVAIEENMPDVGAGAFPIAFGNWKLGYRIVDRLGTRILRDPYSDKPFVHFYATKRVAGAMADTSAIKFLKCEA